MTCRRRGATKSGNSAADLGIFMRGGGRWIGVDIRMPGLWKCGEWMLQARTVNHRSVLLTLTYTREVPSGSGPWAGKWGATFFQKPFFSKYCRSQLPQLSHTNFRPAISVALLHPDYLEFEMSCDCSDVLYPRAATPTLTSVHARSVFTSKSLFSPKGEIVKAPICRIDN
ncbi:hypothetical protein J6590_076453 [Homalodisca vitripennis]|nr:hypothetical protein J6590_076453 [Homalodisca vitripennis]